MATFEKGILGGFSGKVGTVVGVRWRGRNVMRSVPQHSTRPASDKQREQREKFRTVVQFLTPMSGLLTQYFGKTHDSRSPFNQATSYHLNNAVVPSGDAYAIDYPKVLISRGDLQGILGEGVTPQANQELLLTWTNNSDQGNAHATDKLIAVVYAPVFNSYQQFEGPAVRSDATATLALPLFMVGTQVQVWASFATAQHGVAATSSYLGEVTVQ